MYFIWILIAIPIASLLCAGCLVVRGDRPRLPDNIEPISDMTFHALAKRGTAHQNRREIKWITTEQAEALLHRADDLIFINLRSENQAKPLPFSPAHILSIEASQLLQQLRWLPPTTSVALYAPSALYASMLWTVRDLSGSAPVYVVIEVRIHSEAT